MAGKGRAQVGQGEGRLAASQGETGEGDARS